VTRNVRTYDHFCLLARALERLGDRWSLLVIRDLLTGPKRFTDLMDRLGGITPKTLSQRLRELDEAGVVQADRVTGRREVWYQLTDAGQELGPAVDDLAWWAWRHAWAPPDGGQRLHAEHLLMAVRLVLDHEDDDPGGACIWHLRFVDDGEYTMASDGEHWSVSSAPPGEPADVTVVATTATWLRWLYDPTRERADELGLEITGPAPARSRFERLLRKFPQAASAPR
jgi:DNA-binding HxlR family transcriptional regulator